MENRRFHRVNCSTSGDLIDHGITYRGRLENISLRGAMISSHECIMIPVGETCTLSISLDDEPPLVMKIEVVHAFFSMVGVRFVSFDDGVENRLFDLMQKITAQPDKLLHEWQEILARR